MTILGLHDGGGYCSWGWGSVLEDRGSKGALFGPGCMAKVAVVNGQLGGWFQSCFVFSCFAV